MPDRPGSSVLLRGAGADFADPAGGGGHARCAAAFRSLDLPDSFHEQPPGTVSRHERPRIGQGVVRWPVVRVGRIQGLLEHRMGDGVAVQVQRLREVAGWVMGLMAQHGHDQQMPVEREIEHHGGGLWQLIESRAQPPGQRLGGADRTWHTAQQGHHGFDHECAAALAVVVGALAVELTVILGHQCDADEVRGCELRKFRVEKN